MQTLSLSEFRAKASEMIDLVEKEGETVRILRHGKPVAELVPVRIKSPAELPAWKRPLEPLRYTRAPIKSGAQMIVDEREAGL
jgi:prevent-host-death family protein